MRAALLLSLLVLGGAANASSQGARLPVAPGHWSYELLRALDAAGLTNAWFSDFQPSGRGVVRGELERAVQGAFGGTRLLEAWDERFREEMPLGRRVGLQRFEPGRTNHPAWELRLEAGVRHGDALLDPGAGARAVMGGAFQVGPIAGWVEAGRPGRERLDDPFRSGGIAFPLGPFDVALGRMRVKAAGPSPRSSQLGGHVPLDALYAVTRDRSPVPGLGWLFGPVAWQFALAPWTAAGQWERGWIALGGAVAEPTPNFRIGLVRTSRFGGEQVAPITPVRLLRTALTLQNEPNDWDDHKLEVTFSWRGNPLGQPLALHGVIGQEDTPPWRDPAVLAGFTVPIMRPSGLWVLGYEYDAIGARARFCPICDFDVFTPEGAFSTALWYLHSDHPPYQREGIPVGAHLGGYGASHRLTVALWDPKARFRLEGSMFFQVREEGNLLLERWPGKRRGGGIGGIWFPRPGVEVAARALYANGPEIDFEWGGKWTVSWAVGGGGVPDVSASVEAEPTFRDGLRPGDRIHIWSPRLVDRRASGEFEGMSGDTLRFQSEHTDTTHRVPLETVHRLRVVTGSHPATVRGAFIGATAGLIAAIAYDEATGERDEDDLLISPRWGLRIGIFSGVTGLGALIGSLIDVDEWTDVRDLERR